MNQFLQDHSTAIMAVLTYVALGLISTMPPKDTAWSGQVVYDWLYDFLHMILNSRNGRPTNPTQ